MYCKKYKDWNSLIGKRIKIKSTVKLKKVKDKQVSYTVTVTGTNLSDPQSFLIYIKSLDDIHSKENVVTSTNILNNLGVPSSVSRSYPLNYFNGKTYIILNRAEVTHVQGAPIHSLYGPNLLDWPLWALQAKFIATVWKTLCKNAGYIDYRLNSRNAKINHRLFYNKNFFSKHGMLKLIYKTRALSEEAKAPIKKFGPNYKPIEKSIDKDDNTLGKLVIENLFS